MSPPSFLAFHNPISHGYHSNDSWALEGAFNYSKNWDLHRYDGGHISDVGQIGGQIAAADGGHPAVEGPGLHESGVDFFPQLGHPVLGQRWVDLPEVKVRVVPITPTHETADLAAVTVTGLLAAGAAALGQEPFDQQGVASDVSASLG